jgi:hypothetical protein
MPPLPKLLRSVDLATVDPRDEPAHLKAGVHIPGNGRRERQSGWLRPTGARVHIARFAVSCTLSCQRSAQF